MTQLPVPPPASPAETVPRRDRGCDAGGWLLRSGAAEAADVAWVLTGQVGEGDFSAMGRLQGTCLVAARNLGRKAGAHPLTPSRPTADEVDGSLPRHRSAIVGLLSGNPSDGATLSGRWSSTSRSTHSGPSEPPERPTHSGRWTSLELTCSPESSALRG